MSEEVAEIIGADVQLQSVAFGPQDVIVLFHPQVLSEQALVHLRQSAGYAFPNNKVMIVEEDISIGVMQAASRYD